MKFKFIDIYHRALAVRLVKEKVTVIQTKSLNTLKSVCPLPLFVYQIGPNRHSIN